MGERDEPLRITRQDDERIAALRSRWRSYHRQFLRGTASRETVVGAYTDWADALDGVRQERFEATQGAKILDDVLERPTPPRDTPARS